MSAVCAHAHVANSRHQPGALDAFPSASSCALLDARSYLEPSALYASMGGDFDRIFRYWSADVCCVHCHYCKQTVHARYFSPRPDIFILTQSSGSILVVLGATMLQNRLPDDLEL
jgi:hypothetical protein